MECPADPENYLFDCHVLKILLEREKLLLLYKVCFPSNDYIMFLQEVHVVVLLAAIVCFYCSIVLVISEAH